MIRVFTDVRYDTMDKTQQVLDLYVPLLSDAQIKGFVMWVPGGAWFHCDHRQWNARQIAKQFASYGYVVASVKYRVCALPRKEIAGIAFLQVCIFGWLAYMSSSVYECKMWLCLVITIVLVLIYLEVLRFVASKPLARFPVPLVDCVKAWNLVSSWFDDWDRPCIVAGHSAGAHLAMMLSLSVLPLVSVPSSVLCFSGIYSPDVLNATFIGRRIAHVHFGDEPAQWPACFPTYHLKPTKHPSMLLINGQVEYGLVRNMLQFSDRVRNVSPQTYLEHYVISHTSHFSIVTYWHSHLACVWDLIERFLHRNK